MSAARDQHGGEADDDHFFLDQVLNKLYDFGESEHFNNRLTYILRYLQQMLINNINTANNV